jgi:hypothetical protein
MDNWYRSLRQQLWLVGVYETNHLGALNLTLPDFLLPSAAACCAPIRVSTDEKG